MMEANVGLAQQTQRELGMAEGLLPNPFDRARVDYEAKLLELLGSGTVQGGDVPANLVDDYYRLNIESAIKRENEITRGLSGLLAAYPDPDHDPRLEGDIGRTFSGIRDILRSQLVSDDGPYDRGALVANLAAVEADLYRMDHGALHPDFRPYMIGKLIAFEWILGRRESLDPVTAKPHPMHPRIS